MSMLPATPAFLGLPWDPAAFSGRGHLDIVTVNGVPYRRFQGMHVAALLELDARVAGAGQGVPGLYRYRIDPSSTADADPGAGRVRLNAAPGDATLAFIDVLDESGADLSAAIDAWDASTSAIKGTLRLASRTRSGVYAEYDVTGAVAAATGYRKVPLTLRAAVGMPFQPDEAILAGFVPRADKGDQGDAGTPASTTVAGVSRYATTQEALAGAAVDATLTPADAAVAARRAALRHVFANT